MIRSNGDPMTESKPRARKVTAPAPAPAPEAPKVAEAKPAPKPEPVKTETRSVKTDMTFKRRMSQGDHGPAVAEVQRLLSVQGDWEGPLDGRFGTLLARSLRVFQGRKNLRPTGEVDLKTWEALNV